MKKLFIILIISSIAATGCIKDKKSCWGCVLVFSDGYVASYRDSMICDKTQADINSMKRKIYDASAMGYRTYEVSNCSRLK